MEQTTNLPSSTVQSHASNLLQLPDRTLLCVWFGGTQEGVSDIAIYISRLSPSGSGWTSPVQVSSDETRSEQNPVLFRAPKSGTIWLFHTAQVAGNQDQAVIVIRKSKDDGQTWSAPSEPFPEKKGAFVRQPLVVLPNGTWILPIWYCRAPPGFRWVGSDDVSAVLWTKDDGETWNESVVPDSRGCVHMNIVRAPSQNEYVALFRSRWADNIYRSTSTDGINWTAPTRTTLRNPNSSIAAVTLPNGDITLVFNDTQATSQMERRQGLYDDITPLEDARQNQPSVEGKVAVWGTPRRALSVGLSSDGGQTWKYRVLEDGEGWCMSNSSKDKANKELSYPSICLKQGTDNGIHVAYTFHRQYIKYVSIDDVEAFVDG